MSTNLDNQAWLVDFSEETYVDLTEELDDEELFIPILPSSQGDNFLRARRRYRILNNESNSDSEPKLLETPETPQMQELIFTISPPPLNRASIAIYKERVKIYTLREADITLEAVAGKVNKPITTVSYIARNPITSVKRAPIKHIFDPPARKHLVRWLELNPIRRRFTYGQIIHILGFACSESIVRRALVREGYCRGE
jgi:hypothetical protein